MNSYALDLIDDPLSQRHGTLVQQLWIHIKLLLFLIRYWCLVHIMDWNIMGVPLVTMMSMKQYLLLRFLQFHVRCANMIIIAIF